MGKVIKNNRGQALIEFILIMPVFIFIIMAIVDLGNIIYKKYQLENTLDTVSQIYESGNNAKMAAYAATENVDVSLVTVDTDLTKITISQNIDIITPGLSNIIGKNYKLLVHRTVYTVGENNE